MYMYYVQGGTANIAGRLKEFNNQVPNIFVHVIEVYRPSLLSS